jgi:hypothetical protein
MYHGYKCQCPSQERVASQSFKSSGGGRPSPDARKCDFNLCEL